MKINMDATDNRVWTVPELSLWAHFVFDGSIWRFDFYGAVCVDISVVEFTASLRHIRATPAKLWEENND